MAPLHKKYINIWWAKDTKNITVINYKKPWKMADNPPIWKIRTNGGRRKNGDKCLDFFIHLGYLVINYTNFDLQRERRNNAKK